MTNIQEEFSQHLVYVGVHCRRGDQLKHYRKFSGATVVDHHFFDTAFDIYRQRYNDGNNKVIFLAVTDDIRWTKVAHGFNDDSIIYLLFNSGKS